MKHAKVRGDLKRWFQYVNGEPAMCLAPRSFRVKKNAYVIGLSAAHKYLDEAYMLRQCGVIIDLFDLGFSTQRLAQIASFITDGFDELVKLAPPEKETKIIGEGEIWVGSEKLGFDITNAQLEGMVH